MGEALNEESSATIEAAYLEAAEGGKTPPAMRLCKRLDFLFNRGDWEESQSFLAGVDMTRVPSQALTGLLCITSAARTEEKFAGFHELFLGRILKALKESPHDWDDE
jgi:hypothetical protein